MGRAGKRIKALASLLVVSLVGCSQMPLQRLGAANGNDGYNAQLSLARLLEHNGQSDRARQMYQELAKKYPNAAGPAHRLAILEHEANHPADAERWFRKALDTTPQDVDLLNDYGYWLLVTGRAAEAESLLAKAHNISPKNQVVSNNYGMALGRLGRFNEALELFRTIGSDADAHANLAYIHVLRKEPARARAEYRKALNFDPSLKTAADALAQLEGEGSGNMDYDVQLSDFERNRTDPNFSHWDQAVGDRSQR